MRSRHVLMFTVLGLLGASGAMGPPLLAPLREAVQDRAGLSRAALGMGFMGINLLGGLIGLLASRRYHAVHRTTWFRAGAILMTAGLGFMAWPWPPDRLALGAGLGWLVVSCGIAMLGTANGIFADLWDASPHRGVILLHAVNALGKVAAPVMVLLVGASLDRTSLVFAATFLALTLGALAWPRSVVRTLAERELTRPPPARGRPELWLAVAMFVFIAGSEAGVTAMVGSLVELTRPPPWPALGARRGATVAIVVFLSGILLGRVVFTALAARWSERRILAVCLLAGALGLVPAAWGLSPGIYLPGLAVLGLCFSATWPAWFGLTARTWPESRTFLSFGSSLANAVGISVFVGLASVMGNDIRWIPAAILFSAAAMIPFPVVLFGTRWGRSLGEPGSVRPSGNAADGPAEG